MRTSNPRWSDGHAKAGRIRNFERRAYLNGMSKAFDFCIPRPGAKVPAGPDWLYELRVERDAALAKNSISVGVVDRA
jgi:hypothetical protein